MKNIKKINKKDNGITLIALVITIILMLILAGIVLNMALGENGFITKAIQAKEEAEISQYKETIELIKTELIIEKNGEMPTLTELKTRLSKESWVKGEIEEITDEGIQKLKLTTKEGYIFYITGERTEYKGKGEVKDTSALQLNDVITFTVTGDITGGKRVRITENSGKDYYKIVYQIDSQEEEGWQEITSGSEVDVNYGSTLYAKLKFGSDYGLVHSIEITHEEPQVAIDETPLLNVARKTNKPLGEVFEVTWGSEGTGTIEYQVSGTKHFNNVPYSGTINNLSELELGEYEITCVITRPGGATDNTNKVNVVVNQLADTTVTNTGNTEVGAKAIYSEDDFMYFKELVGTTPATNAKQMDNLTLTANTTAIGTYNGIYDGQNYTISGTNISASAANQGLFGYIENAYIKNVTLGSGSVTGTYRVGGLVGYAKNSTIYNVTNGITVGSSVQGTTIDATSSYAENYIYSAIETYGTTTVNFNYNTAAVGGICGLAEGTTLENNINKTNITKNDGTNVCGIGGIIGYCKTSGNVKNCQNDGELNITGMTFVGGILGTAYGNITTESCTNNKSITVSGTNSCVGGIAGWQNGGETKQCTNNTNAEVKGYRDIGGIIGFSSYYEISSNRAKITSCTNKAIIKCDGYLADRPYRHGEGTTLKSGLYHSCGLGGIVGYANRTNVTSCSNIGNVYTLVASASSPCDIGGISGQMNNATVSQCSNTATIGTDGLGGNVGGIIGAIINKGNINNSYNTGSVYSTGASGGIIGWIGDTHIEYCYNRGAIKGSNTGGIVGEVWPYSVQTYGDNYVWYCYNAGTITSTTSDRYGGINGYFDYLDTDYVYSLNGTATRVQNNSTVTVLWGVGTSNYKNATHQGPQDKSTLVSTVTAWSNFKADKSPNINDGFPILNWQ